ncbi:MAG TPA: response regulator [Chloroflexota bacterium]|nr:response regulator [Chloroflexota bacterium]HUM67738.1 response regulator [Chloroflexota bacterium]
MENIPAIIESIALLAWPVIVIVILFSFRSSVKELIESGKSRKFTVKVAGNELTMEEINDQQRTLIADLQKRVGELQEQVDTILNNKRPSEIQPSEENSKRVLNEEIADKVRLILWVDDQPKNNSFLIQGLQDQGIQVVTALSTNEAIEKFQNVRFDRVITDMGRQEDGRFNPVAGIELTKIIRRTNANVPIFAYTSSRGMSHQQAAYTAGITGITTSPSELLSSLQIHQ